MHNKLNLEVDELQQRDMTEDCSRHRLTKTVQLLITGKTESLLLRHADGTVRNWRQPRSSTEPTCLVTTVQAGGGVMVWGMFSLGPLVSVNHCLNATAV